MKDIKAILEGFTLTDAERETIIREVGENYRSIVEVTKKAQRIEELESQNKALTEQVGSLEGHTEELETLRSTISEFQAAEERRKANETEAAKRDSFRVLFDSALEGKEFTNGMIHDSVFEKAYERCAESAGYDVKEAIKNITDNMDGIWKNPQQDARKMPTQSDISGNKDHEAKSDRQTIANFMFGKRNSNG